MRSRNEVKGRPRVKSQAKRQKITKRTKAEETLRISEETYSTLVEKSNDGIVIIQDGLLQFANSKILEITNFSLKEVLGKPFIDFISPEYRGLVLERYKKRMSGEEVPGKYEIEIVSKDGKKIVVEVNASIIEHQGKPADMAIIRDITEHKQLEDSLKESEEKYRSLVESVNDIIFSKDSRGYFTYISPATVRVTKYKPDEVIGQHFSQFLFPEDAPQLLDRFQHALTGKLEALEPFECRTVSKEGKIVWLRIFTRPQMKEGQVVGFAGTMIDITEHKKAEEALRASAQQWQTTFDAINDVVCLLDREGNILRCNNAMTEFVKKPFDEIVGRKCWELVHGTSEPIEGCPIACMRETHHRETLALSIGNRWYNVSADPILDESGNLIGAVHIIADITERKKADEALIESEKKYRTLFESSMDAIYISTRGGKFIDFNQAMLDLFGYTREEMLEINAVDLYADPTDRTKFIQELEQNGFVKDFEAKGRKKDGTNIDFLVTATALTATDGSLLGSQGIVRDITNLKRAEDALRQSEASLARAQKIARLGNFELDLATGTGKWSTEMFHLMGFDPSAAVPSFQEFLERVHPEDRQIVVDTQAYAIQTSESVNIEFRSNPAHGPVRNFLSNIQPIRDTEGHAVRLVGTLQDITEQKRVQEELQLSYQKLQKAMETTVEAISTTIEIRDPYTSGHQRRVTQLACVIAEEMGLPKERIEGIRMAGIVHDIGKIYVPADILSKPSKLNEVEFSLVKVHPQAAYDILKGIEFPWPVAQITLQHHERMNGSGYPAGLSDDSILLEARILAVADVVEAMASHRPYRAALGTDLALEEISKNKGILYDPEVVEACLRLFYEKRFKFE